MRMNKNRQAVLVYIKLVISSLGLILTPRALAGILSLWLSFILWGAGNAPVFIYRHMRPTYPYNRDLLKSLNRIYNNEPSDAFNTNKTFRYRWTVAADDGSNGNRFVGLGDISGGQYLSEARAVSANGSVVVGSSSSEKGEKEAFRWTVRSGLIGLGALSDEQFLSEAYSVSANGSVVVGYSYSQKGIEAFRWTKRKGMVGLGDLQGGKFESVAYGVSGNGSIVVGYSDSTNGRQAFRWTARTGMVGLGDIPGGRFESEASAVSASGLVVVGYGTSEDGKQAFYWTHQKGMVPLGDLPGGDLESRAYAVSADGSVVAGFGSWEKGVEACLWYIEDDGKVMVLPLGTLPNCDKSVALGISPDGSVVVGWSGIEDFHREAFIWDAKEGMRSVQDWLAKHGLTLPDGSNLLEATGVTVNGNRITVVGTGITPEGDTEGWIAVVTLTEDYSNTKNRFPERLIPETKAVSKNISQLRYSMGNEHTYESSWDNTKEILYNVILNISASFLLIFILLKLISATNRR